MTKIEALKELLRENTSLNGFKINFKSDEFIVLDENKNVVFKDLLKNYDLDYDSQKKFILNVFDSITSFVDVLDDIADKKSYFEDLIKVNERYYYDVVGGGDIYDTDTYISVNMDKLYENCKKYYKENFGGCEDYENIGDCEDFQNYYNDYIDNKIDCYMKKIKSNFDWKGVRVVLYCDDYMYDVRFYVSAIRYEDKVYISYIEELDTSSNIEDLVTYDTITLYYSLMGNEKKVEKAVKFIKELVA